VAWPTLAVSSVAHTLWTWNGIEEGALVASSRDRQRKLARAKVDRQMARRAAAARRKRQIRAGMGALLAVMLVIFGAVWLFGGFERDPDEAATAKDQCGWTPQDASQNANLKDVGTPPTKDLPTEGTRPMTVATGTGTITVELDVAGSPCGTASLAFLAEKKYYDGTTCHELTDTFLRCGDASGTGQGGPAYSFFGENVPTAPEPTPTAAPSGSPSAAPSPTAAADAGPQYLRGTVALVAGTPGNYGSQFVIFHKDFRTDQPDYSIVGRVTGGLDVLDKIVKAGTVADASGAKVKPAKEVEVTTLTVGEAAPPAGAGATPTPPASSAPSPTASAQS
jgi:peptidyl-prolyl cis-trans isomerase B (cyclophilin B)